MALAVWFGAISALHGVRKPRHVAFILTRVIPLIITQHRSCTNDSNVPPLLS